MIDDHATLHDAAHDTDHDPVDERDALEPGAFDRLSNDPAPGLRQRKKDMTQRAISDAAWALFTERGYEQTSVNDIAERANVAPRTFFRYFPSKEAVMYPEIDEALEGVAAAFAVRPADEALLTSLISSLDTLTESMAERNEQRIAVMKGCQHPSIGEYFRERLIVLVDQLVRSREPDHPDVELRARLASGIIGLIVTTARDQYVASGYAEPMPDIGHRCVVHVLDLLAAPRRHSDS